MFAALLSRGRNAHLRFMTRSGPVTLLFVIASIAALSACRAEPSADPGRVDATTAPSEPEIPDYVTAIDPDATETSGFTYAGPVLVDLPPLEPDAAQRIETERDWAIALGTVEWARTRGLERLPIGDVIGMLGATFVGSPAARGILERPGPERLVVNLRTYDWLTFVEHMLALGRIAVAAPAQALVDEDIFRALYRAELERLRYRNGVLAGYPSRLHYFSEWLRDAEAKGLVQDLTRSLGGTEYVRSISYLSSRPDEFPQLSGDPRALAEMRAIEARLSTEGRFSIGEDRVAAIEGELRTGDIIATVSTVDGQDVAHAGIALLHDGRIHLVNAPLTGDSVEVSVQPLADRMRSLPSRSGIMVARPVAPPPVN